MGRALGEYQAGQLIGDSAPTDLGELFSRAVEAYASPDIELA